MVLIALFLLLGGAAEAATCPVQDVGLTSSVEGTLTATDCRLRDVDPASRATTYVNQFRVTLTERGIFSVSMTSAAFNTYLYLYDAKGAVVAQNDDADGTPDSRITMSLQAGKYIAVASSRSLATGAYTLKSSFETPRSCSVADLTTGTPVSSALTEATCRTLDIRTPSNDERPVDRYRLTLSTRRVVTLNLTSADFDTYLELYDSTGQRVALNHDGGGGRNSRILVSLDPGAYIVFAYPWVKASGAYTLQADTAAPRQCPVKELKAGESPAGTLTLDSCRILDLLTPSTDASFVDTYRITAEKRSVLTLDMASSDFDTYLVLTDARFQTLFENDDADDNSSNSRILGSVDPGTYLLLATTYDISTGSYTGAAKAEDPRSCPAKDIRPNDSVTGTLVAASCRVLDLLVPSEDTTLLDPYRVVVEKTGVLTMDLASRDFSPYLFLVDEQYESKYELDSQGDPRIAVDLLVTPGTYYIFANTDDYSGAYTLKTSFKDPRVCPAPAIGTFDQQSGRLSAGGCTFQDIVPFTDAAVLAGIHRVSLTEKGDLTVTVNSTDFPPALFITDADYQFAVGVDLNDADAESAQAVATLAPGEYKILVLTLVNATGTYGITTSFSRPVAPR